jgi:hypothetical protein
MNVTFRGSARSYTWGGAPRKQLHPHLHPLNLPSHLAILDVSSRPLCQLHKPAEPLGRFLLRPLERSPLRFGCEGITMPHHEDFLAAIRVRLWWWFVDWICYIRAIYLMVVDVISWEIQLRFPWSTRSILESCLACETNSNRSWWEVVDVWPSDLLRLGFLQT